MLQRDRYFLVLMLAAILFGTFRVLTTPPVLVETPEEQQSAQVVEALSLPSELPDFSRFSDVQAKKEAFFSFLRPMVDAVNRQILARRAHLEGLWSRYQQEKSLSEEERSWLLELARQYQVPQTPHDLNDMMRRLLLRVDVVPASLALAQAANESAWGTSRFARHGNNLFGQWCFKPGCGLVPEGRPEGEVYEVRLFASPMESVRGYIRNLNTNIAYREFRKLRAAARERGQSLEGMMLAEGLGRYSSRGAEYIEELRSMIRYNELGRFDHHHLL